MARLGHASPRASLIYQHAAEDRDRRIAEGLDAMAEAASHRQNPPYPGKARRVMARKWHAGPVAASPDDPAPLLTCAFLVVGTGVDPVTSRFSVGYRVFTQ
ncbi:MAG: hypothetical protein M3P53_07970 [Actinomycetota bacterium]|nr:hypothetical protein [Actinomycetota bacterium]